jgi:hypothetical protein
LSNRAIGRVLIGVAVGFAIVAALYLIPRMASSAPPERVSQDFFLDTYTRNFASAWERVSKEDQAARTKEEYLSSNPPPGGFQDLLYNQLAKWGKFEVIAITSTDPARALVSAHMRFPDVSQQAVDELLELALSQEAEPSNLLDQLSELMRSGQLKFIEGNISIDLALENNRWRVAQHWGQSITVHLKSAVSPNLDWDFYPVVSEISALPGELVSANYFARNNSEETVTGKAIHEVGPPQAAAYFETIQCFCFTEQTLEPGEEREMVLMFRIDFSTPRELSDFDNLYTFYTIDRFPADS